MIVESYDGNSPSVDLEFQDLVYQVGNKRILNGVTGKIEAGKLTAIMGPSGSGKSSLINVFLGKVEKTSGRILMNQQELQIQKMKKVCFLNYIKAS